MKGMRIRKRQDLKHENMVGDILTVQNRGEACIEVRQDKGYMQKEASWDIKSCRP